MMFLDFRTKLHFCGRLASVSEQDPDSKVLNKKIENIATK